MESKKLQEVREALEEGCGLSPSAGLALVREIERCHGLMRADAMDFQGEAVDWARECFGREATEDARHRAVRFLEEALELAQACDVGVGSARGVVHWVYSRPRGAIGQEIGGVALTLAVLAASVELEGVACAWRELRRVQGKVEEIRERESGKPKFVPGPAGEGEGKPERCQDCGSAIWIWRGGERVCNRCFLNRRLDHGPEQEGV